jgi:cell division protein FtsI/penicillin-binding protein 2
VNASAEGLSPIRLRFLLIGFLILSLALSGRLAYWQVVRRAELVEQASAQVLQAESVAARRGSIYDQTGRLLATTVQLNSVYAIPRQVRDRAAAEGESEEEWLKRVAAALGAVLGESPERLRARLESGAEWVFLKRRVSEDVSGRVKGLGLPGIGLEPEPKRLYPNDAVGAALLGFVNDDGLGGSGVEARFDRELRGVPGRLVVERDPADRELAVGLRQLTPPVDGADLVLTLDLVVQNAAERELARAMKVERAAGGTVVVLDPDTGAIVALASAPGYDPNNVAAADPEAFRDRAVSWTYEPGSTMKPITIAAALNAGVVEASTSYEDKGYAVIGGRVVRNAQGKVYGRLDLSGILEKSANAGAVFVGARLGAERLHRYLLDFGFGRATGVDLAAESTGTVRPLQEWYPIDVGTASFGQGLSATPLQVAAAYGAIANGGTLYRPYVVAEVRRADGSVQRTEPQALRRVIAPETASLMRDLLTNVVDRGLAQSAKLPGYSVAGKTGTAQIASPDGRYVDDEYVSSFAGLVPARDPRFVCVVVLERPASRLLGTLAAMSVFTGLASDVLRYARIEPDRAR